MIKIELINPQDESPAVLRAISATLLALADQPRDLIPGVPGGTELFTRTELEEKLPVIGDPDPAAVFGGATVAGGVPAVAPKPSMFDATPPAPAPLAAAAVSLPIVPAALPASPPPPPSAAPSVAPVVPAPVVAASAPAPIVGNLELDSSGLPYDVRIHQSGRNKKADGTWKVKKGLDKTYAAQVEFELRAHMGVGSAVAAIVAPSSSPAVPGPIAAPAPAAPPPPAAAEVHPADLPIVNAEGAPNFQLFMAKAAALMRIKAITSEQLTAHVKAAGLEALPNLATRPDLIPAVNNLVRNGMGLHSV
jgi:hypothetical protein